MRLGMMSLVRVSFDAADGLSAWGIKALLVSVVVMRTENSLW